jgi:dolichol-phosphate mannosyltransferase
VKQLSVIAPVYNEETNLPIFYQRCSDTLKKLGIDYEIIFVDDGSKDGSAKWLFDKSQADDRVHFIRFSRNFGHQMALTAGLDHASGKAIVIIDTDLQDPPELIEQLYRKHLGGYEVVYAKRRKRKGEGWFKLWTAKAFYRIMKRLTSFEIPLDAGDFRLIDQKVAEVLRRMPEQQKFYRGQVAWAGFRQNFVEYDRDKRLSGKTNYPFRKMLRLAIDAMTSFSDAPIRFVTTVGFLFSLFAFGFAVYALLSYFAFDSYVPGWTSLMIAVTFIGGVQLICIGIIGEYVSRVSANVRGRPPYVVMESSFGQSTDGLR